MGNEKPSRKRRLEESVLPTPSESAATTASETLPHTHSSHKYYSEDAELAKLPQTDIDNFLSSNMISFKDDRKDFPSLRPILSFAQLPAALPSEKAILENFKTPTPIQSASWPYILSKRDVIGVAETGSGKTLAFGLPCVRRLFSKQSRKSKHGKDTKVRIKALILSPTRELALQTEEQLSKLADPVHLGTVCVYGGSSKDDQRKALRSATIVIATPGRLRDFIDEGSCPLDHVRYLVLDEADRMLDKGFEEEIKHIISCLPSTQNRQTLMFTATWPKSVRELASIFMADPVQITVGNVTSGELRANKRISQEVEVIDPKFKETRLLQLLRKYHRGDHANDRILIFCLYKKEASRVENFVRRNGFKVAGIHGDMNQQQRIRSLDAFKRGQSPLLVATDVAARGLDIPDVELVINVTFPLTIEDYVHRIGRTGRAGKTGKAITFFTEFDKTHSGELINILKGVSQPVPEDLMKFGTTVKKKVHEAYGAFYKDVDFHQQAKKIKFDD